jgi:hypothetical protein
MAGYDFARGEDDGYLEFWGSGANAKGEFHCSDCGYGVIVAKELPICPMCGGHSWEHSAWSPFARAASMTTR